MKRYLFLTFMLFSLSAVSFSRGNGESLAVDDYTMRLSLAIQQKPPGSIALFRELRRIHQDACKENVALVYPQNDVNRSGKTISLLITKETAQGLPLPEKTDFNGWTFEVDADDSAPDFTYLFRYSENNAKNIPGLGKAEIDSGSFENVAELRSGTKLLIVEDKFPWTYRNDTPDTYFPNNRPGTPWQNWDCHDPKYRRDILLLKNGTAQNKTIAPYNTTTTIPNCKYVEVSNNKKLFQNINLHRVCKSKKVVRLFYIHYANNVELSNIRVETDPSPAISDACITFVDAANVTVKDYTIQKTYSTVSNYGYGMDMNNVWNTHIINMVATSPQWGVLGNNNMNKVRLDDCTINRFDVHCYTRDITCNNCTFRNDNYLKEIANHKTDLDRFQEHNYHIYNRFSSIYGTLEYNHCTFDGFYPFLNDYAYNIYSDFDVSFNDCSMKIYQSKYACLMRMGFWGAPANQREEHARRCLPNVTVNDMSFFLAKGVSSVYVFFLMDRFDWNWGQIKQKIYHTTSLRLNNIVIQDLNGNALNSASLKEINLGSNRVRYAQEVRRTVNNQIYKSATRGADDNTRIEVSNK